MAKKINEVFKVSLKKNNVKGGAWLCDIYVNRDEETILSDISSWANASAAKRYIKERVQALTPRKSIKLIDSGMRDEKDKPIGFNGELSYKVDAVI